LLSTPENDKTDKKRNADFASENSQSRRGFFPFASGAVHVGSGGKFRKEATGNSPPLALKLAAIGFDQVPAASA